MDVWWMFVEHSQRAYDRTLFEDCSCVDLNNLNLLPDTMKISETKHLILPNFSPDWLYWSTVIWNVELRERHRWPAGWSLRPRRYMAFILKFIDFISWETDRPVCIQEVKGRQAVPNVFNGCAESRRVKDACSFYIVWKQGWITVFDDLEPVNNM